MYTLPNKSAQVNRAPFSQLGLGCMLRQWDLYIHKTKGINLSFFPLHIDTNTITRCHFIRVQQKNRLKDLKKIAKHKSKVLFTCGSLICEKDCLVTERVNVKR